MKKLILILCLLFIAAVLLLIFAPWKSRPWLSNPMSRYLPHPGTETYTVLKDTEDTLLIDVAGQQLEDFQAYVVLCREAGFRDVVEEDTIFYYAYNEKGYFLELTVSKQHLYIHLNAPEA